jgi:hypothetical protein
MTKNGGKKKYLQIHVDTKKISSSMKSKDEIVPVSTALSKASVVKDLGHRNICWVLKKLENPHALVESSRNLKTNFFG